ncbi:hypothetical protein LTR70_006432 [Exophiala xenobiotica]|uniref:Uncharacterized protein n=1 Tax=Lithohypha guttulata TaxID=1690604 RepID=A0ABR0K1Z3_9EURO|nr:hypothetical protein LTR24_007704 [Lithohypha guttulata]KAK5315978.1 hypothetical protein LTR70_006432 [Exophiala xenobiotica]
MSLRSTPPSLASRERERSCLPQTRERTFPVTPVKRKEGAKQKNSTPSNDTPTPTSTIRERRGRRQYLANGDFHPLSIFTKSALFPFHLDTEKAFEILKGDSPERLEEAKNVSSLEKDEDDLLEGEKVPTPEKCTPSPRTPASQAAMDVVPGCSNSDMDLITALKMTSPEKDHTSKVRADFVTLCELPIPESSQHPAFSSSPFEAKTEAPLLFTSTSIDEIRLLSHKNARRVSSSRMGRESIERKRSFFGLEFRTPSSARIRNAFSSLEDSPLPLSIPAPSTGNTFGSIKSSSPLHTEHITPRESASSHSTTNSVRKFSDLFRRKDSIERNLDALSFTPRSSQDSPHLARDDLERYLRTTTNTPTYDHDPTSPFPRHPNTARGWKSRNLKCTTCIEVPCAVCQRTCCAFRAAVLALDNHLEGSPGRTGALQRIQEITKVFPYGREVPTFLQCTEGDGVAGTASVQMSSVVIRCVGSVSLICGRSVSGIEGILSRWRATDESGQSEAPGSYKKRYSEEGRRNTLTEGETICAREPAMVAKEHASRSAQAKAQVDVQR